MKPKKIKPKEMIKPIQTVIEVKTVDDFEKKSSEEQIEIARRYYILNLIETFGQMFVLVLIALVASLVFIAILDNTLIKYIFLQHPIRLVVAILALSVSFTLIQWGYNVHRVHQPMKEFVEATRKIVSGDFSARLNTKNLSFRSIELIVIGENFNKMVAQLEEIDSISNDFVSNVSHELKTPLAVIQSYVTILQNPYINEEQKKEYLEKILVSTKQLTTLVTNILKLNKLENNQLEINKTSYNISSQLGQCVLDYEDALEKKGLNIEFDVEDDIMVKSDPDMMYMVWKNLLSNAIKFTPENGTIRVSMDIAPNALVVSISDNGCGMSEETKRHIFEKFYQGDTSHSVIGNGLGLALVKRVIDQTGNDIEVKSVEGEGTTFIVTIYK